MGIEPSNKRPGGEEPPHDFNGFMEFLSTHKWDAVAYVILFLGLLLSIFERLLGGLIVGFISGLYFSKEMQEKFVECKEHFSREGIFRAYVTIVAIIAVFIASPGLIIGTIFGAFLNPYLPNVK